MAWTQADLDKIDRAIANMHRRVRFADKEVEYKSTDDMLKARAEIKGALDAAAGTRNRTIRLYGSVT